MNRENTLMVVELLPRTEEKFRFLIQKYSDIPWRPTSGTYTGLLSVQVESNQMLERTFAPVCRTSETSFPFSNDFYSTVPNERSLLKVVSSPKSPTAPGFLYTHWFKFYVLDPNCLLVRAPSEQCQPGCMATFTGELCSFYR
ncbi:unnamed protein product [Protopolystoma xenopodis]|uniref:Uncharacterized protein n=1 Tax=Protopolystoma xenopodis TaxID=117903 RepID=A0A448XGR5_9PLAT|nr:unnamed protein product [Protopolystoma xenopodis]